MNTGTMTGMDGMTMTATSTGAMSSSTGHSMGGMDMGGMDMGGMDMGGSCKVEVRARHNQTSRIKAQPS